MRKIDMVLAEMREGFADVRAQLRAIHSRIDSLHVRVDTVIDSLADLRSDLDRHTHDN